MMEQTSITPTGTRAIHGSSVSARIRTAVLLLIYCVALEACYTQVILPIYRYEQIPELALNLPMWCLTTVVLGMGAALLAPNRFVRPSDLVFWVLYLTIVLPFACLTCHMDSVTHTITAFLLGGCALGMSFILRVLPQRPAQEELGIDARHPFFQALWGVFAFTCLIIAATYDLRLVDFNEVYDLRLDARVTTSRTGYGVGYLMGWVVYALNGILLAYGTTRRRWTWLAAGLLGTGLIYTATGAKVAALLAVGAPLVCLCAQKIRLVFFDAMIATAALPAVLCLVAHLCGTEVPMNQTLTTLTMRTFYLPAHITGCYIDYFSVEPLAVYGDVTLLSSLTAVFRDKDIVNIPRIIGERYFGNIETNANANIWADGYANLGWVGVVLHTAVLGVFLRAIDRRSNGALLPFWAGVMFAISFPLANGALTTCFITNGLFWVLALAYLGVRRRPIHHEDRLTGARDTVRPTAAAPAADTTQ